MQSVFITHNPLEAEEFVLLTSNQKRAEEIVFLKCSRRNTDKTVYVIDETDELREIFDDEEKFAEIRNDLSRLKNFSQTNCTIRRIDKVLYISRPN